MNVYMVKTKDERTWTEILCEYGGPEETYWPHDIFAAETASQAKSDALHKWSHQLSMGVYSDDFLNLRTRLLARNVDLERGEVADTDAYWLRYHELLEHGGKSCSCEYAEAAA